LTRAARTDAWPRRIGSALAGLALLAATAVPARASVEEFSTFAIAPQERDDESVLDHFLTRMPRAWRDEWQRTPGGLRTSQGCLTSGQWFVDAELKARAPLGERAWLGVGLFQSESDILDVRNLDLSFHFPQPVGSAFAIYRPDAVKAAQDFAVGWEAGSDTSVALFRATWMIEDIFNHFWAFRQTQVGDRYEPYERHPHEPAIDFAFRRPRWRLEAGGKWLTPSRQRVSSATTLEPLFTRELWGVAAHALAERRIGPALLELRGDHRQANGHERPLAAGFAERAHFRRQWSAEGAARFEFPGARGALEARYLYQSRTEFDGPRAGATYLQIDDRVFNFEVSRELTPRIGAQLGALYHRVGVARENLTAFSFGTRSESRVYLGLEARFGRVRVIGIEGVELDDEAYDVRLVHDKGFLKLQTVF